MTLTPHTRPMAVLVTAWAASTITTGLFLPSWAAVIVGALGAYALVCLTAALVLALLQLTGGPTLMTRHRTTPTTTEET